MSNQRARDRAALICFAILMLAPAAARAQLAIECLAPLDSTCAYSGSSVDVRLPINLMITENGNPAHNVQVAFTTTHCCLEPAGALRSRTDSTGVVSLVWAGKVPGSVALVSVIGVRGAERVERRITIANVVNVGKGAVTRLKQRPRRYIWYKDDHIPDPAEYRILGPVDEASCEAVAVTFTPHLGGTAGPNPAQARWYRLTDSTRAGPDSGWATKLDTAATRRSGGNCIVGAQWRLATSVGTQYLQATVLGADPSKDVSVSTAAVARQVPRFTAGFAYVAGDTGGRRKLDGIFGAELPVFWGHGRCLLKLCERLRLSLGTTFSAPREDFFGGVVLAPLFLGTSRESVPVQLSAVLVNRGRYAAVVSFDASTVFSTAVGLFK